MNKNTNLGEEPKMGLLVRNSDNWPKQNWDMSVNVELEHQLEGSTQDGFVADRYHSQLAETAIADTAWN